MPSLRLRSASSLVTPSLARFPGVAAVLGAAVAAMGAMAQSETAPAGGAAAAPAPATSSSGAAANGAGRDTDTWFVLTGDNVYVRVTPDTQLGYPFAKLQKGEVVKVIDREGEWMRIRAEGPSFGSSTAYVLADTRATISEDGTTLTVTKRATVLAPNVLEKAGDPTGAWKVIATLDEGTELPVTAVRTANGRKYAEIALPAAAEGWISASFLAEASAGDIAAAATPKPAPTGSATAAGATEAVATATGTGTATDASTATAEASGANGSAEGSAETATDPADPRFQAREASPERLAKDENLQTFKDLETMWCAIREQPDESEELTALVLRYEALITALDAQPTLQKQAQARAEQIRTLMEVQENIIALAALRAETSRLSDEARAVAKAIEARSDFNVVGTLNASIVYDGGKLPLLYRIQNPMTGATVAYLQPQEGITADLLATMLGTLVGVKGDMAFDPSLGVNLVKPRALESLTPSGSATTAAPAAGAVEPAAGESPSK